MCYMDTQSFSEPQPTSYPSVQGSFDDFQSGKRLIAWCGQCTLQQLDVPSGYFG